MIRTSGPFLGVERVCAFTTFYSIAKSRVERWPSQADSRPGQARRAVELQARELTSSLLPPFLPSTLVRLRPLLASMAPPASRVLIIDNGASTIKAGFSGVPLDPLSVAHPTAASSSRSPVSSPADPFVVIEPGWSPIRLLDPSRRNALSLGMRFWTRRTFRRLRIGSRLIG